MSLNTIRLCLIFLLISIFTGCTKTIYSSNPYRTYQATYSKVAPQKIRDSKAMHRATMKSYVIAGIRYYPTTARVGDKLNGIASWYGPNFHSKLTSNGEIYNMYAMTAAHKTLPMNTMVKVVNLENGKNVIVRVNDRGPFVAGRIIDLSNVAAHKIDMVKKGTARVKVTILGFSAKIAKNMSKFYLQVGAFQSLNSAKSVKRKFNLILDDSFKVVIKKTDLNLVWISGFRNEREAENFKIDNNLKLAIIIAQ